MGIVAPVAVLQAKDQAFIDQPSSSRVVNRGIIFFIMMLSWLRRRYR
jgi:hypothetical protein